ncbi:3'-5' exonuclease [Leptolyngbya ohadii]|uniref:3'-5' exonuclease n=1 Tax=Leptolyngbya ohadii TaxID=1962290 RepID=UPI000B599162|nr:3'-5' exonuclease [Leptolyngbya ohadii]
MTTFVALDFETADNGRDSACAIGLVRVENWQIIERIHYLIRPPRPRVQFTHIHGIRWKDVAQQPCFGELWEAIEPILKDADFLAAHNATFDRGVLHACCDAHGLARPSQSFVCTVQLARKVWNIRPTKLPDVCQFLDIELNHHQALSDAEACARIVIAANLTGVPAASSKQGSLG